MYSIWSGHEVQARHVANLKFSVQGPVDTLTDAEKKKHWTGRWWRIDARSSALGQQQQHQQPGQPAQQNPTIPQPPQTQPQAQVAPAAQGWLNVVEATEVDEDWDAWIEDQKILTPTSQVLTGTPPPASTSESRLSIVISSEATLTGYPRIEDRPTALRYISLPKPKFLSIVQSLAIHRGHFALIHEGSPTALVLQSTIHGRPCEVHLLRTSNAIDRQSAMTIVHFPPHELTPSSPGGNKVTLPSHTTALLAGLDAADVAFFTQFLQSAGTPGTALPTPQTLVVAFLEIEKTLRFRLVRNMIREMQTTVHTLSDDDDDTEGPARRRAQLNKTVDLFFAVHHLRADGLVAWRDQLAALLARVRERQPGDRRPEEGMVEGFLGQLVARYEHRIARCDLVLQGVSLAFQMETTQLSREDTKIAIGDGKTMKAIAVLTMVFLPPTFFATLLAVPQIEKAIDAHPDNRFGDATWLWYLVLAVPVTVVTVLAYWAWEVLYKRRYLKSLFGEGKRGKGEEGAQGNPLRSLGLGGGGGGAMGVGNGGTVAVGNGGALAIGKRRYFRGLFGNEPRNKGAEGAQGIAMTNLDSEAGGGSAMGAGDGGAMAVGKRRYLQSLFGKGRRKKGADLEAGGGGALGDGGALVAGKH